MHLSMLSPRGEPRAYDFSEGFLVKIAIVGLQNLVKSDQISPTYQCLIFFMKSEWILSIIHTIPTK